MKKHSKKLAIFFSLLPGAGHMYLGLIKKGMELMGLFFFVISIVSSFNFEIFAIFIPIIWFYSVFDINEKTSQDEPLEDGDLPIFKSSNFTKSIKASNTEKYIAYILIAMGVVSLIDNVVIPLMEQYFDYAIIRSIKDICISAILIGVGIFMLKGKKVNKLENNEKIDVSEKVEDSDRVDTNKDVQESKKADVNNEIEKNENVKENNEIEKNENVKENNEIDQNLAVYENAEGNEKIEESERIEEGEKQCNQEE